MYPMPVTLCGWRSTHKPVMSKIKGHPFEVMTEVDGIPSAVLADQVKSLDWKVCNAKRKGTVAADVMVHVRAKIKALLLIS